MTTCIRNWSMKGVLFLSILLLLFSNWISRFEFNLRTMVGINLGYFDNSQNSIYQALNTRQLHAENVKWWNEKQTKQKMICQASKIISDNRDSVILLLFIFQFELCAILVIFRQFIDILTFKVLMGNNHYALLIAEWAQKVSLFTVAPVLHSSSISINISIITSIHR